MERYHQQKGSGKDVMRMEFDRGELERLMNDQLHQFALRIGVAVLGEMIEDEVTKICGPRRARGQREGHRYGRQAGFVVVGGQKVRIDHPRVRTIDNRREVEIELYRRLQREDVIGEAVMRRLLRGVSCRNYREVTDTICESVGVSRSSVSRTSSEAMDRRVRELASRRFTGIRFPVIFIDGVSLKGQMLVAAIGVTDSGQKTVLSVREGATENSRCCMDMLEDLRERGISTDLATLFVLDGSKALRSAVERVWGRNAWIQRCRVHKLRNVQAYVPKQYWPEIATRIRTAYAEPDYKKARASLLKIVKRLESIAPAAAASLREGLEETLTVTRLKLPAELRRGLMSTNVVENVFSRVRVLCSRVKRWRPSMRLPWCSTALLEAEKTFHRLWAHQHLAQLLAALDSATSTQANVA